MDFILNIVIIWIACAVVCYYVQRDDHKAMSRKWTQIDRMSSMSISLIYGPMLLLIFVCASIYGKISESKWAKREAKW